MCADRLPRHRLSLAADLGVTDFGDRIGPSPPQSEAISLNGPYQHSAVRDKLCRIGAHLLQCDIAEVRCEDGMVHGPKGSVTVAEIASIAHLRMHGHRLRDPPATP